jgi:hypothetical protein
MQPTEPSSSVGPPWPTDPVSDADGPRGGKRSAKAKVLIGAGLIAALAAVGAGSYAIGAHGTDAAQQSLTQTRSQLDTAKTQLATANQQAALAQGQLHSQQSQLRTAQAQAATARAQAATAQAAAQAQARAAYAAKMASLTQQQQSLSNQEQTVQSESGQLQASSISADGVYVVGQDIKSGTWHTPGDGGAGTDQCYFATLRGDNTVSAGDIIDNNSFDGTETVDVAGVYALQISGKCTWYLVR